MRASSNPRHYCICGNKALFFSPGRRRYVYSPSHPICRRCWRSLRARFLA